MVKNLNLMTFIVLKRYPHINWQEAYTYLFERCIVEGDHDLAKMIFREIINEGVRTKDSWALKMYADPENEFHRALHTLGLTDTLDHEIERIKTPEKNKRKRHDSSLCACCHSFVLTRDEIQLFPMEESEEYIKRTFSKAMTEPLISKRTFLADQIISNLEFEKHDINLIFELWYQAEINGCRIHLDGIEHAFSDIISDTSKLKRLVTIYSFSSREHDLSLDDLVAFFLARGRYGFAKYFINKMSSPYRKIMSAIMNALLNRQDEMQEIEFLENVLNSVRHEKVRED